jgi:hypothetical protein
MRRPKNAVKGLGNCIRTTTPATAIAGMQTDGLAIREPRIRTSRFVPVRDKSITRGGLDKCIQSKHKERRIIRDRVR